MCTFTLAYCYTYLKLGVLTSYQLSFFMHILKSYTTTVYSFNISMSVLNRLCLQEIWMDEQTVRLILAVTIKI